MFDLNPKIVYEDDSFLAVDKPSGLICVRAQSNRGRVTLQDWLEKNIPDCFRPDCFSQRNGIVHRLDKDASGLILVAKKKEVFKNLQDQFRRRTIVKTYLALVWGKPPKEGTIRVPTGRLKQERKKFGVIPDGRFSETGYKVLETFPRSDISLVEVYPKTGRTHQIRVHFCYLGNPLVGDSLYGRKEGDRRIKSSRLFLHAHRLVFWHPKDQNEINLNCKLPRDFKVFLSCLRKKRQSENKN